MYTNLLFLKNEYIKFCACMIRSIVRLILVNISIYQTNSTCEILKTEARNNYNGIRTFRVNCDRSQRRITCNSPSITVNNDIILSMDRYQHNIIRYNASLHLNQLAKINSTGNQSRKNGAPVAILKIYDPKQEIIHEIRS